MVTWGTWYRTNEKPPPDTIKPMPITCRHCGIHTNSKVISTFVSPVNEDLGIDEPDAVIHNFLLSCTYCDGAMLVIWPYWENSIGDWTKMALVYPFPTKSIVKIEDSESIPKAILEDMIQAELSDYVGAEYGAGLLLRRACQNICRDQGCPDTGGLEAQIKELAARSIITSKMAEMADGIRIIGNELAHPDPNTPFVITSEDVRTATEFLTQLVRVIYVDPAKAQKLKDDLASRGVD